MVYGTSVRCVMVLALSLGVACGESGSGGDASSGGAAGSAGARSGGAAGSSGSAGVGSGGVSGSGAAAGSGGASGSGGAAGSGGSGGSGGSAASGGSAGSSGAAGNGGSAGSGCVYPASYGFISQLPSVPSSAPAEVPYLSSWSEPNFGTTVRRMSTLAAFGESTEARHGYSRRPAYNADGSIVIIAYKFVDVASGAIIRQHPFSKERWSASDPDVLYGISGSDGDLYRYQISTQKMTRIWDFDSGADIGAGEGNFSNDDRHVVIADGGTLYSLDIGSETVKGGTPNPTLLGTLAEPDQYNWASFSQLGQYILVEQDHVGLTRYDADFKNPLQLAWKLNQVSPLPRTTHGDFALDDRGRDVFAMISWDYFSYIDLADGSYVQLGATTADPSSQGAGHGHVSGRAYRRPGWIYSSTNPGRVVALRLGRVPGAATRIGEYGETVHPGIAEIEQYGFHFSSSNPYGAQPKAVPNPCGTSVLATSDMHGEINDYEFSFPQ